MMRFVEVCRIVGESERMSVEETGYYNNFCIYCSGSGVVDDYEGERDCSACDGRGQWDDAQPDEDSEGTNV